jgi:hypothetical protein
MLPTTSTWVILKHRSPNIRLSIECDPDLVPQVAAAGRKMLPKLAKVANGKSQPKDKA